MIDGICTRTGTAEAADVGAAAECAGPWIEASGGIAPGRAVDETGGAGDVPGDVLGAADWADRVAGAAEPPEVVADEPPEPPHAVHSRPHATATVAARAAREIRLSPSGGG